MSLLLLFGQGASGGTGYVGPGDVVPGAKVWVGLRGYNAAYAAPGTNPALIVRRASDGTSATINILSDGRLDVATATTFMAGTTGFVSTFYDQTGSGVTFTETTTAYQPQLLIINGLPYLSFQFGISSLAGTLASDVAQPWTVAAVSQRTQDDTTWGSVLANEGAAFGYAGIADTAYVASSAGDNCEATATDGATNSLIGIADGANSAMVVNGTATSGNAGTAAFASGAFYLGNNPYNAGFGGLLSEIGLWPGGFSATEYADVNANAYAYWIAPPISAALVDTVATSDNFTSTTAVHLQLTDTVSTGDAFAAAGHAAGALADAVSTGDAFAAAGHAAGALVDNVATPDAYASTGHAAGALADTVATSDSFQRSSATYSLQIAETVATGDSLASTTTAALEIADYVTATTAIGATATMRAELADDVFSVDTIIPVLTLVGVVGARTRRPRAGVSVGQTLPMSTATAGRTTAPRGSGRALFSTLSHVQSVAIAPDIRVVLIPPMNRS